MPNSPRNSSFDGLAPSPATLFHTRLRDAGSYQAVHQGFMKVLPLIWLRDRHNVRKIQKAETLAELLDLAPQTSGLAEFAWHERLAEFGETALPGLVELLTHASQASRTGDDHTIDRLISEMRWRGPVGALALADNFAALDDYGKSLACVALGLLQAAGAGDLIWNYYQQVRQRADDWYFIAALWGLVDLQDQRACPVLLEWLSAGEAFYELFGFLALVGDETAIVPLLEIVDQVEERDRYDLMMAAAAIGQRIGRPALEASILKDAAADEASEAGEVAERLMAIPQAEIQRHFDIFYRGFQADDARALETLARDPARRESSQS